MLRSEASPTPLPSVPIRVLLELLDTQIPLEFPNAPVAEALVPTKLPAITASSAPPVMTIPDQVFAETTLPSKASEIPSPFVPTRTPST